MSEKEIRCTVKAICEDLDRRAHWVVEKGIRKLVLPAVFGAGLVLAGCEAEPLPDYGGPFPDTGSISDSMLADMGPDVGPQPAYGVAAPDAGSIPDGVVSELGTDIPMPMPAYMSPDPDPDDGIEN